MHIFTSEGIVIHKLKYLEFDLIVTIFSKTEGKINAIVKGGVNSRKRFPGAFEIGNTGEFGFIDKNQYQLINISHAKVDNYFINLKKDYDKTMVLFYMLGITDVMLIEHQSHPRLFDILIHTLRFLEINKSLNQIRLFYELHLLKETGLLPAIEKCESCGRPFYNSNVNFIIKTGKLVCESCTPNNAEAFMIPANLLGLIKTVNNNHINLDEFLIVDIPHDIFNVTTRLMSNYIDRPLKIWQMIDTILL
jgi:DNA repair protein RecO (recombination protein O)